MISTKSQVQFSRKITFGEKTVGKAYAFIITHTDRIAIRRNCAISCFNLCTGETDIIIGDNVRTGPGAVIHGARRKCREKNELIVNPGHSHKRLVVEDDVLVGASAMVFECRIGQGAFIGAGSVAIKDISPYAVALGAPAKVIDRRR